MVNLDQYVSELGHLKRSMRLEIIELIKDADIRQELIDRIFSFLASWEIADRKMRIIESQLKYQSVEKIIIVGADVRSIFGKNEEKFQNVPNTNMGARTYVELFILAYLGQNFCYLCAKFDELESRSHIGKIA